jgi:hypothetical protein
MLEYVIAVPDSLEKGRQNRRGAFRRRQNSTAFSTRQAVAGFERKLPLDPADGMKL